LHEETGKKLGAGERGIVALKPPLPPGTRTTVWGDDRRFAETYFSDFPEQVYSTFDWGMRDEEGYYFVMKRSDDVINIAGHRLGTREIEEAISGHPEVAEVAAVGVKDEDKGRVVFAYVVPKDGGASETDARRLGQAVKDVVDEKVGAIARPAAVYVVEALPKTRSGKPVRRSIQAIAEDQDPAALPTIEVPSALDGIVSAGVTEER
jgi:propionyl-CoA synthetase